MYQIKWFFKEEEPKDAFFIREEVFVKEQGFTDEFDEQDKTAYHLCIYEDGVPVATGRLFPYKEDIYKLGRIAVMKPWREKHLGKMIMDEMEEKIRTLGGKVGFLSAQMQAKGFYEKVGYTEEGEIYLDQHCPHIDMRKNLVD